MLEADNNFDNLILKMKDKGNIMSKINTFQHRFYDEIEQLVKRGINQYILYGNELFDDLFFTHTQGSANISDSIAFNLYKKQNIAKVFSVDDDGLYIYDETKTNVMKRKVKDIKKELIGREDKSKSLKKKANINPDDSTQINQQKILQKTQTLSDSSYINLLKDITEALTTQKEPIAIIINSLQWRAELFEGKEHRTSYLEEIEKWKRIDMSNAMHFTFLVLNSIDVIQRYLHINEKSKEVIYIGGPTVDEITEVYRNLSFRKGISKKTIQKTASLVKNNAYSLNNAINLYGIIKHQEGDGHFYDEENFYRLFVQQLQANVDEEVEWKDIILNQKIKDSIINKFQSFLNSKNEVKKGAKGFLFYGPPGTGKTYIAKALANKGGFYFMAPKLADIKGEYVGHSSKNVQKIFNEARANAPTLMFLDELDSLFPQRGGGIQDSFQADITNQFLAEIDGVASGKQDIFLIGATNRIDIIDSAMVSRLEEVNISLPDFDNRKEIFQQNLKDLATSLADENYALLAKNSNGLSGRDIKNVSEYIVQHYKKSGNFESASGFALSKFKNELAARMKSGFFDITIFTEDKKDVRFNKIIGYEEEKEKLSGVVDAILEAEKYKKFDKALANYNGILMYGPPGNGKTHIAHCLANEYGLDFVKVIGSSLATNMQDGAIKLLEEITQNAIKLSALHPIMLFFDEFDAIINRNMDAKLRGTLLDRITYMRQKGNILLVAATNSELRDLDEATIRDGRFDEKIYFNHPQQREIVEKLFEEFSKGEKFNTTELNYNTLASNFSIGEKSISSIEKICNNAKRKAVSNTRSSDMAILKMEYYG